jgi:hypothetical protein
MVARHGDLIVGAQGVIPQSQFDSRLPRTHIFLTLWKALEDRAPGVGLRLYKGIIKEYAPDFAASIGVHPRLVPFHKWQGFRVGTMDHHVALSPHKKRFRIAEVPEDLKTRHRKAGPPVSFRKLNKEKMQDLDSERLFLHQWPLKSNTYIVNRYMNHPVYRYDVYAVSKDGYLIAICVIRPVSKDGSVALRFVDFAGPNEAFGLLGGFVSGLLKTHDAEYMDIYSHGVPSAALQKAGFVDRRKVDDLIVPNYFEPFERRNIDLIFACKTSQEKPAVRLFKADSDQDRPNQIQTGG